MQCGYYAIFCLLSQEAVEEKLSSTLFPFASQRTGAVAMNSNLGM